MQERSDIGFYSDHRVGHSRETLNFLRQFFEEEIEPVANIQVESREDRIEKKEKMSHPAVWTAVSHEPQRLQILLPGALDETSPQETRKHLVMPTSLTYHLSSAGQCFPCSDYPMLLGASVWFWVMLEKHVPLCAMVTFQLIPKVGCADGFVCLFNCFQLDTARIIWEEGTIGLASRQVCGAMS